MPAAYLTCYNVTATQDHMIHQGKSQITSHLTSNTRENQIASLARRLPHVQEEPAISRTCHSVYACDSQTLSPPSNIIRMIMRLNLLKLISYAKSQDIKRIWVKFRRSQRCINALVIVIWRFLRPLSNTDQYCSSWKSVTGMSSMFSRSRWRSSSARQIQQWTRRYAHTQLCMNGWSTSCWALSCVSQRLW